MNSYFHSNISQTFYCGTQHMIITITSPQEDDTLSPLCLQPKHEQTQTSNNDFLNSLGLLNWVLDFEKLVVYGNILIKLILFAKLCVTFSFVGFFTKILFELVICYCYHYDKVFVFLQGCQRHGFMWNSKCTNRLSWSMMATGNEKGL